MLCWCFGRLAVLPDRLMDWKYKCDGCGCYLDPGEGLLCEECRERTQQKIRKSKRFDRLLNIEAGQVEMRMEEMV